MHSAIAVLTYRRLDALKETMRGLDQHCAQYPTAILEDLGNRDGTEAWLREGRKLVFDKELLADECVADTEHAVQVAGGLRPDVEVFLGSKNLGVAGNSNRALRWFEKGGWDHLCLLNDDLHVLGDFVSFYAKGHRDLGIEHYCFCDFTSESYRWFTVRQRGYGVKLLPRLTGIMMSVTRSIFDKVGYFDPEFLKPNAAVGFGQEHSVPGNSLIWMGDYTFKPISEVKSGDKIIGWRWRESFAKRWGKELEDQRDRHAVHPRQELCKSSVLAVKSYKSEIVKLTMASGRVLFCTPDHQWLNAHRPDHYYTSEKGRKLVYVVAATPELTETPDYVRGYIQGAIAGDGTIAAHSAAQRSTHSGITERVAKFSSIAGFKPSVASKWYKSNGVSSDYVPPGTPGAVEMRIVRLHGKRLDFVSLANWMPATSEDWRGWMAGIYDAEGSGNGIGQCPKAHPKVYDMICKGLAFFGFDHKFEQHEVIIRGGYRELVRFCNLTRPVASHKFDRKVLVGRFKRNDVIANIEPAGEETVYCLRTSTGNYVVDGYASKNCDFSHRCMIAGGMKLDGQDQNGLDLEHMLLKHQDVITSVTGPERARADQEANVLMQEVARRYRIESVYRPFALHSPKYAGGSRSTGIPTAGLKGYTTITDLVRDC